MGELVAVVVLALVLLAAIQRPFGGNEAVVGVPAAALVVGVGLVPMDAALATFRQLLPTVLFLAAILAFGHLCAGAGVFAHLATLAGRAAAGRPTRLLALTVALAAVVTAVLTLDATVVLLTPVVLCTARRVDVEARPDLYACLHLANAGSLLLPVSNLTNLLAFTASGLSFGRFAALMTLPWLLTCLLEWSALRAFFRRDLHGGGTEVDTHDPAPRYAMTVLGVTVVGLVVTSALGVTPALAAFGGVLLLGVPRLLRREVTPREIALQANPGFCVFVVALGVVVDAVTRHGLGSTLVGILPDGDQLLILLVLAFVAAGLANIVNNLPATLVLLPVVAGHPTAVLAVLLGVNIGPNLTYVGSLATLLWRRLLPAAHRPRSGQFHALGAVTVPPVLAAATVALWASSIVLGV
ncbi:MAG TPA: SLC13 family permease [Pseudonocardia sp.]|nr:SLC13 family permease [Pseudonocardia sp.]